MTMENPSEEEEKVHIFFIGFTVEKVHIFFIGFTVVRTVVGTPCC